MQNHLSFTSKLPTGWGIQTHFGRIEEGNFIDENEDFARVEDVEMLHLRLLQYFKDFQQFPSVGDFIIDDTAGVKIHEKTIDLKEKVIIFHLI